MARILVIKLPKENKAMHTPCICPFYFIVYFSIHIQVRKLKSALHYQKMTHKEVSFARPKLFDKTTWKQGAYPFRIM